jgi:multiple sugar transport system permease protein
MVELVDEAMLVPSKSWTWFFPRVRPGCIKVGLFAFLTAWNEFVAHLVFDADAVQYTDARARLLG